MRHFSGSIIVSVICLALAAWWGFEHGGVAGAATAFGIALILGIMEISLSFDNAVVNASVLKNWDAFWQRLFLTVGVLVAVFGMRLIFPLVIVAQTAGLGAAEVWDLALNNPHQFSAHLTDHHDEVAAFGGVFLLLVFLHFIFDEDKELHWLAVSRKNWPLTAKFMRFRIASRCSWCWAAWRWLTKSIIWLCSRPVSGASSST